MRPDEILAEMARIGATQKMCQQETAARLENHGDRIGMLEKTVSETSTAVALIQRDAQYTAEAIKNIEKWSNWAIKIFVAAIVTTAISIMASNALETIHLNVGGKI
jgi:hypothetical protein